MEHSWVKSVYPLLTLPRIQSLFWIVAGETRVAIDNVLDRPRAKEATENKVAGAYLDLLAKDIQRGQGSLGRFRKEIVARWRKRVANVKIDREADRIEGDVGL